VCLSGIARGRHSKGSEWAKILRSPTDVVRRGSQERKLVCEKKQRVYLFVRCIALLELIGGCSLTDDPLDGGQCLSYPEKKKRCDDAFTDCLDSWIQSIPGDKKGHSQCHPCRDLCMQNNGVWPGSALNKPCR
jgi:hypothetical protein